MTTAELSQRMSALERANQIRTYRARLKDRMASGDISLAEVMRSEDPLLATMRIRELLLATPRLGTAKVARVLTAHRLTHATPLSLLGASRREQLLLWIETNYPAAGSTT